MNDKSSKESENFPKTLRILPLLRCMQFTHIK